MIKNYKIVVTPFAKQKLIEIRDYICLALSAPDTANHILQELLKSINSLITLPCRYRTINTKITALREVRKIRCKNYYIYYWVNAEESCVFVLDVIYVKANQDEALHIVVKSI